MSALERQHVRNQIIHLIRSKHTVVASKMNAFLEATREMRIWIDNRRPQVVFGWLLRLDHIERRDTSSGQAADDVVEVIQQSLHRALTEVREIASGFGLPELRNLTVEETVMRVVRRHERRTQTGVALSLEHVPRQVSLPVKITLYRVIQEALSNAYRHAAGVGQQVRVACCGENLRVEVSDYGPGFELALHDSNNDQLGLAGMRERVESLGGHFQVQSKLGQGTLIVATLSLTAEERDER